MADGWNDGLTKEMSDYLNSLEDIGEDTLEVFVETICRAVDNLANSIYVNISKGLTGELKASFKVKRLEGLYKRLEFDVRFWGENKRGEPYEKIANVLNYGRPAKEFKRGKYKGRKYGAIKGTDFVTNAIRKLKGLDDIIDENIGKKIAERTQPFYKEYPKSRGRIISVVIFGETHKFRVEGKDIVAL